MGEPIKINKLFDFSSVPREGEYCIYCLFDLSDTCIYVGQTKSLERRIYNHFREGKDFVKFSFDVCEKSEACELEAKMIVDMNPPLNKKLPTTNKYISTVNFKAKVMKFISDNEDRLPVVFTGASYSKSKNKKYVTMEHYDNTILCMSKLLIEPISKGEE